MADGQGLRLGLGFDSHARDETRPLHLGGLLFEGEPGLAGHSDADVVCHALADALLGACGRGDLGEHFPDTDERWAGIGGLDLLARAVDIVREAGFEPSACDIVVIAERPGIAGRRDEMRASLGRVLGTNAERVSIKGKRPEGMGLTDDGAACLALAVVTG